MSDGLNRLAGAETHLAIAGKTYRARRLTVAHYAEIEARVVSLRPDLLARVFESLEHAPAEHQAKILDAAMRRLEQRSTASEGEVLEYLNSLEGACFLLWLMVRDGQPEIDSVDKARQLVAGVGLAELQFKLDLASGMADLKNSAGPAESATGGPAGPTGASGSPGHEFTGGSAAITAGHGPTSAG